MNVLEKLLEQGFAFRSFPAYPRHLGVEKYHCAALLELSPEGRWKQFSSAGYLLDSGAIALLVQRGESAVFVHKGVQVPGEGELIANYRRFLQELKELLEQQSS
jgi:hypothetical protein